MLEQRGKGSATYYSAGNGAVPTDKLLDPDGLSSMPDGLSSMPERLSSMPEHLSSMPTELKTAIEQIGKRTHPEVIQNVIYQLCAWKALKAEEIALITDRNETYLVNKYLTPMVENGILRRTHPEMIRHPDQAYEAAM